MALTRPVLCLMGPTASGKSAAAAILAGSLPVEIVSVDSALVYRGMDVGTAKPSATERAQTPHHLIDILEPEESYSAARFVLDANHAIAAIVARGRIPLLVGGTMLYFRALQRGLDAMPSADPEIRRAIEEEARERGWPALHADLMKIDPVTAKRLATNDSQRIQRALEVFRISGTPLSSLHQATDRVPAPWRYLNLALEPRERPLLHARIERRFDDMLEAGFLDEVRGLMRRGTLDRDKPSMRSVGYRQAWEHLLGESDFATMRQKALAATRQLAKHQLTWLRSTSERQSIDCFESDVGAEVVKAANAWLASTAKA